MCRLPLNNADCCQISAAIFEVIKEARSERAYKKSWIKKLLIDSCARLIVLLVVGYYNG